MRKTLYLLQPQFSFEINQQKTYWIPYSVGCLWSYASQFKDITDNYSLAGLEFSRKNIKDVLDKMQSNPPDVCGFSCYVWNNNYCLELAKAIKNRWPNTIIVFGGPQCSERYLDYLFIDAVVLGEGEEVFLEILRSAVDCSFVRKIYRATRTRLTDLPSPYATGVFDQLVGDNPEAVWSMTFETNRGCPYQCTFCDWGSLTYSKIYKFDMSRIEDEAKWAANNPISYMICADANFGIFKERDLEIARLLQKHVANTTVDTINLNYAKNSTEEVFEIAQTLGNLSRGLSICVQSMNPVTLGLIKRKNLDINNIKKLMFLSEKYHVTTYTDMILGLPGETLESWKWGLSELLELGQHDNIDINFCELYENAELNSPSSIKSHGIEAVSTSNYMPYVANDEEHSIAEEFLVVKKTSTMSSEDIVQGYMWGWLLIQFHITGYTQYYAKYSRHVANIPYQQYYEKLLELVQKDDFFSANYTAILDNVRCYITTGSFKTAGALAGVRNLGVPSFKLFYENKDKVYSLGEKCLLELIPNINAEHLNSINTVQKNFVYSDDLALPKDFDSIWDLVTWEPINTKYTVTTNRTFDELFDFYIARRKGFLKNIFQKAKVPLTTT